MKTKNIKANGGLFMIAMLLIILISPSCKKALDNELDNATYDDKFWKTEADAQGAISGAYALLRTSLYKDNAFFIWGDLPVGEIQTFDTNMQGPYLSGNLAAVYYREEGAHNWTNWYKVINVCNLVIDKVPSIPDASFANGTKGKNYVIGEAYFLRALCYFYLARVWGDVPLQNVPIYTAEEIKYLPQSPEDVITKQVQSDAGKASALLTFEGTAQYRRARANKGAALALLAHVSAWRHEYDKTVLYTDSIISRVDTYKLETADNIRLAFKNSFSTENIFVITASNSNNEANFSIPNYSEAIGFKTLTSPYLTTVTGIPLYFVNYDYLYTIYPNDNDARLANFYGYSSSADVDLLIKYSDVGFKTPNQPFIESNLIIYRLADMYLLKAEALNFLTRDPEARTALNVVRERANTDVTALSGNLLKIEIMNERIRELAGEGQNFFDGVRMNRSPVWMTDARKALKGWRWPIANSILQNNNLINQTEFWKGKY
ncbi:RagB/SusD family nutrient uptake outer membrane protein [Pedobacter frigidisoli]|uniref:RagB/SusD family nutrient uptake outer membrane protein n=1 Tax=Pedobacter frigidisoli TaxID=2530455 RepID=A0A4R0P5M8_9SPHI|nr:RagB/SusD family nutrient uptake outer membrane protein [Pedobacter frigidisoli]TCD10680.1 RagB/SusD family nutrient uptake outer membrane protein [Pedobacter frigidisoli]